jgi:hypothetical protein
LFVTVFEVLTEGNEGTEGLVFEAQIEPFFSSLPSVKMLAAAGQENQQKETKVTKGFRLTTQIESSFSSPARESVRSCLL